MKLRNKINISFLTIFVIALSIVGVVVNIYTTSLVRSKIVGYIDLSNKIKAYQIRTYIQNQLRESITLSSSLSLSDYLDTSLDTEQHSLAKHGLDILLNNFIKINQQVSEAFLINSMGIVVASTDETRIGLDRSNDKYFTEAKTNTFFKDVYYSSQTERESYVISSPVRNKNGDFDGVLAFRFNLDGLYQIVKGERKLEKSEDSFLVNKDKYFISKPLFLGEDAILKQKAETENVANCYKQEEIDITTKTGYEGLYNLYGSRILDVIDYRNVNVVATHAYIPETGWCLISKIDRVDVMSFHSTLLFIFLTVFLVTGVIFTAIVFVISNRLTNPIFDIITGTNKIKNGEYGYKINIKTNDEFRELGDAFNKMSETTKAYADTIEERVREQTNNIEEKVNEVEVQKAAILNILDDVENARQEVSLEKNKLEAILYSIGDGVFVVDENLNIILINEVAMKMTGYKDEELIGIKYYEKLKFIFEETGKINNNFIDDAIKTKTIQEMAKHTVLLTKDGTRIPVADSTAPIFNESGKVIGCVVVFRDVTLAREIDNAKTEFVSLASHQLRTPLTPIRLFSEMLLNEEVGKLNIQQKEYVDSISQSSKRMISLVNDLLNVSRLELGRLKIDPVSTNIEDFLQDIIKELSPTCQTKGCELVFNKPEEKLPDISIDRTLMRQVIQNLLTNAIRYSSIEKGSLITISVVKKDNNYIFSVQDNGIGIPADAQTHIFEKFYRAENAIKAEGEGSGLGLYIIKMIVEAAGGRLWFQSPPDSKNTGTVFHVSIPIFGMAKKEGDKGMIQENSLTNITKV